MSTHQPTAVSGSKTAPGKNNCTCTKDGGNNHDDSAPERLACPFQPVQPTYLPARISFSIEHAGQWKAVLQTPCNFPAEIFRSVMQNLIKNPNLTSSHLFRADILYDSDQDRLSRGESGTHLARDGDGIDLNGERPLLSGLARHLKRELQPLPLDSLWQHGFVRERTIVRQFIPRNAQLDRPMVQTCHVLESKPVGNSAQHDVGRSRDDDEGEEEECAVLYIPHTQDPESMPFYHPVVSQLCFLHTWNGNHREASHHVEESNANGESHAHPSEWPGTLTVLYRPFLSQPAVSAKLSRIALRLLQTVHRHGQGLLAGYEKRVYHDQVIPQKRYQTTYARLKAKYGKRLTQQWVEVTDPGKHVFEDIGIAAFLIELWRDSYQLPRGSGCEDTLAKSAEDTCLSGLQAVSSDASTDHPLLQAAASLSISEPQPKPPFPGFVDIGCGNGVLVYLLLSEGYPGWGFDARRRKTWSIFPPEIQTHLHQRVLVPDVLSATSPPGYVGDEKNDTPLDTPPLHHDGLFDPPKGIFIVSNHADELTAWTPLLAYRNASPFIAIPCCSHDLAGTRFRAPPQTAREREREKSHKSEPLAQKLPDTPLLHSSVLPTSSHDIQTPPPPRSDPRPNAPESGSLLNLRAPPSPSPSTPPKPPSAYATLCSYVASLSREIGYVPEHETLRIPSTRNVCIVGRRHLDDGTAPFWSGGGDSVEHGDVSGAAAWPGEALRRTQVVSEVVERELRMSVPLVARDWTARVEKLVGKKGKER